MCNRLGAHKSHRISSSLCSHDNALLYLYWYLYFMLIWPWCILYYGWWEAIKLLWILNLESWNNHYPARIKSHRSIVNYWHITMVWWVCWKMYTGIEINSPTVFTFCKTLHFVKKSFNIMAAKSAYRSGINREGCKKMRLNREVYQLVCYPYMAWPVTRLLFLGT